MSFQAPQAIFGGFQSGQIFQNLKFSPAAHIMGRVLLSSTARNVISSHLTWGVTWIREFGFRFCPEEAKKHWRFEKGSLRTELWFDKHFRFWNQITGRFDLSHYNDREIMIGLSVLSMTVGFMILWNRRHVYTEANYPLHISKWTTFFITYLWWQDHRYRWYTRGRPRYLMWVDISWLREFMHSILAQNKNHIIDTPS